MYKAFVFLFFISLFLMGFTYTIPTDDVFYDCLREAHSYIQKGDLKNAALQLQNVFLLDSQSLDTELRYFIDLESQLLNKIADNMDKIIEYYNNKDMPECYILGQIEALKDFFPEDYAFRQTYLYQIYQDVKAKNKTLESISADRMQYPNMVKIEAGTLLQTNEDGREFLTTIDAFYIDKTEVTNNAYCKFLNASDLSIEQAKKYIPLYEDYCKIKYENGRYYVLPGYENKPVLTNWYGANAYAKWVGKRLPTLEEWRYLSMEASNRHIYTLDELKKKSVLEADSLADVASKEPFNTGVYDLYGNVAEWCADGFDGFKYIIGGYYRLQYSFIVNHKGTELYLPMEYFRDFVGFRCAADVK